MGKQVVVASGYFDPLHCGHVSYLQKAKEAGATLIVIINNDRQVELKRRRQGRKHDVKSQSAHERVRIVRSLECVDFAVESIDVDDSVCRTLKSLHPDVFANGGGHTASKQEAATCQEIGCKTVDGLGMELLLLSPYTQHYDWGKTRRSSCVAALTGDASLLSPRSPQKTEPTCFAELWMGDHPSGPSLVTLPGGGEKSALRDIFNLVPTLLGDKLAGSAKLPFLLKVLSIQKALSIQAHPDRALAAILHQSRPGIYKDANHKPEIAIALSKFEALSGFRPLSEILEFIDAVPELASLLGNMVTETIRTAVGDPKAESLALKTAYSHLMHVSAGMVKEHVERLLIQADLFLMQDPSEYYPSCLPDVYNLVQQLGKQSWRDVGIFSVFFLNHVVLQAGECLYNAPNVPHAYLSGDIVECMACSDNVVRGGLTHKHKDIEVLCEMLHYVDSVRRIIPVEIEPGILQYADPEIEEFQVLHISLLSGHHYHGCLSHGGPALAFVWRGEGLVVISGERTTLKFGMVFLLAAGVEVHVRPTEMPHQELDIFVACCPPKFFDVFTGFPNKKRKV